MMSGRKITVKHLNHFVLDLTALSRNADYKYYVTWLIFSKKEKAIHALFYVYVWGTEMVFS